MLTTTQTCFDRFNCIGLEFIERNKENSSGEFRARSDYTYVQADLALHSSQKIHVGERQDKL